jgi:hypothetical protein
MNAGDAITLYWSIWVVIGVIFLAGAFVGAAVVYFLR